jgi:hypothetical protein
MVTGAEGSRMTCRFRISRIHGGPVGECALLPSSGVGEEMAPALTGLFCTGLGSLEQSSWKS